MIKISFSQCIVYYVFRIFLNDFARSISHVLKIFPSLWPTFSYLRNCLGSLVFCGPLCLKFPLIDSYIVMSVSMFQYIPCVDVKASLEIQWSNSLLYTFTLKQVNLICLFDLYTKICVF